MKTFYTSNIFFLSGRTIRTYTMNICSCNERFLSCKEEGLHYPFILLGQLLIDQKVQVWQELLITILLGRSTRKLGRYLDTIYLFAACICDFSITSVRLFLPAAFSHVKYACITEFYQTQFVIEQMLQENHQNERGTWQRRLLDSRSAIHEGACF